MDKATAIKAIKRAKRVFVSVSLYDGNGHRNFRVSKPQALRTIEGLLDDQLIKADFLDDEKHFLVLG